MKYSSKQVNADFIIRVDGHLSEVWEIHSAIGFNTFIFITGKKAERIIEKVYKKGQDKTTVKPFHGLKITFYGR